MIHHPNFPPSLAITPNLGPTTAKSPQGTSEDDQNGAHRDAFGIEAQREAISKYGIAGRVWEAAYAMCAYVDFTSNLLDFDPPFVEDSGTGLFIVIELGSGTGVVSASLERAMVGRTEGCVIATDLPDVCPLLQRNLGISEGRTALGEANVTGSVEDAFRVYVRPLAWGIRDHVTTIAREFGLGHSASHRQLTHVICSDLVYFPELLGPLLRTLIHLTSSPCVPTSESGSPTKIVISYKIRSLSKETPFWTAFGLWFMFRPVLARHRATYTENGLSTSLYDGTGTWRRFGASDDTDQTFVFVAYRRPESMAWHVPETDRELMEGVGAGDTNTKKGDDTFETILFMGMGIDDTSE